MQANTRNGTCLNIRYEILRSVDLLSVSAGMSQLLKPACTTPLNEHSRPVGSGKTALTLALCRLLRTEYNIGVLKCSHGVLASVVYDLTSI